jgi:hypothetical protein
MNILMCSVVQIVKKVPLKSFYSFDPCCKSDFLNVQF